MGGSRETKRKPFGPTLKSQTRSLWLAPPSAVVPLVVTGDIVGHGTETVSVVQGVRPVSKKVHPFGDTVIISSHCKPTNWALKPNQV